jgi:hypothetical protein
MLSKDCPACEELMQAISADPDLSRVRRADPDAIGMLVADLHRRRHVPGGKG